MDSGHTNLLYSCMEITPPPTPPLTIASWPGIHPFACNSSFCALFCAPLSNISPPPPFLAAKLKPGRKRAFQVSGSSQKGNGCLWYARQILYIARIHLPFVGKKTFLRCRSPRLVQQNWCFVKNLPKWCEKMPKTYDVRITTLDAELEFSVEVN